MLKKVLKCDTINSELKACQKGHRPIVIDTVEWKGNARKYGGNIKI